VATKEAERDPRQAMTFSNGSRLRPNAAVAASLRSARIGATRLLPRTDTAASTERRIEDCEVGASAVGPRLRLS
jgi:hypothetical protein